VLLAEELALLAIDDHSGRHALGIREQLNACLAGLLIAELVLGDAAAPGDGKGTIVLVEGGAPTSPLLSAAASVVAEKGPKIKPVLSHMSRGLDQRLGSGTWDAVVDSLVDCSAVGPATGGLRPRHEVTDRAARDAIISRLRAAASGDGPLDIRTALVLFMTGPANLLEVVAPDRATRKHARHRIDHALDSSQLQPIGEVVRRLLAEAAAAAAAGAAVVAVSATSSG
jgi:Golgi phosphoprotein 3 (GPP34)